MFGNQSRTGVLKKPILSEQGLKERDGGQSLVELAIVMPIFVLVLLGLIQFSNVRYAEILMYMAARHGARVESLNGDGRGAITEYLSKHRCIDMDNISVIVRKRFFEPVTLVDTRIVYHVRPMSVFKKVFPKNFAIQVSYVF